MDDGNVSLPCVGLPSTFSNTMVPVVDPPPTGSERRPIFEMSTVFALKTLNE